MINSILIVLLVLINFMAYFGTNIKLDLTKNKIHSLSDVSLKTIDELKQPVDIDVYLSNNLPGQARIAANNVKNILNELRRENPNNLRLRYIDPSNDSKAKIEATNFGIKAIQFSTVKSDKFEVQNGYLGAVIKMGDKHEVIPVAGDVGNLEYFVISSIKKLESEKPKTVAIAEDGNEAGVNNLQYFRNFLGKKYNVVNATIDNDSKLPEEADVLVIVGRNKKIDDKGSAKLKEWVYGGKGLITFLDKVEVNANLEAKKIENTGLESIYEENGIKIDSGLVVDENASIANFNTKNGAYMVRYPYWLIVNANNINQKLPFLSGISGLSLYWTTPMSVDLDKASIMFSSSAKSTVDETQTDILPTSNKTIDASRAKSYILGAVTTNRVKMALVGDADMIRDKFVTNNQQNLSLALNLVDYFGQDDSMFQIRNKTIATSPLKQITEKDKLTFKVINVALPILILVIIYIIYRVIDRRKNQELVDSFE